MHTSVLVTAVLLTFTSATAIAGGMAGTMPAEGMPMMAQQQEMNQALERARKATDPADRRQAMKAHMQAMRQMMQGMNGMMGGAQKSADCAGRTTGMPMMHGGMMGDGMGMGMMQMMVMMHQRMQMMQQMMSQMLDHQALEHEEE